MMRQVLLVAGVVAASGGVVAALPGPGAGPGGRGQRMGRMTQELGLSDAQVARLRDIREAHQRTAIRRRADAEVARLDLRTLMQASTVDRKALDAKVKELSDLEAAGLRDRVDTMLEMREVLTPEQREKWQSLRGEWMGDGWQGRGGHRGRQGFGPGRGPGRDGGPAPAPQGQDD
jgi:protein CpxP